jgi:hypothetical protein
MSDDGLFLSLRRDDDGGPQRLDDRFGTVILNGVGLVVVDALQRTLQPNTTCHGDRLLECMYGDPRKLVERLSLAEQMASETFGEGPWSWLLQTSYYVTPGCES